MFLLFYNIAIRAFAAGIRIAAIWHPKARLWVRGRKDIFTRIAEAMGDDQKKVVWMHCASLGEFEQGRALLENIRKDQPAVRIVVTFFSPSGYEIMKDYRGADHIFYLPFPTRSNARRFIRLVRPCLVLWIKYDYWYHYLREINKKKIPLLLISAVFHRHHPFFKWYGGLYRKMLKCFTWLFVQTDGSARRLAAIGFEKNVTVNGDTRFDRVIDIADHFMPVPGIGEFTEGQPVVIAGSTWPEDEELLSHYFSRPNIQPKLIIAPHEIGEDHLQAIEKLFENTVRYSQWRQDKMPGKKVLLIDNIGLLSRLYRYATITYVGGGFGSDGVHNVLEAAVYSKPVVFGPVFNKYREAIELLEEGGAFTIADKNELSKTLDDLLLPGDHYHLTCKASGEYVYAHRGATKRIIDFIQENRLLTS